MTYVAPTWDSATNRNVTVDEMNALAQAAAAAAGDSDAGVTALLDNTSSTTYAKVQEIAAASGGATDANVAPILQDTASASYAAVESAVDSHLGGDATGLVTTVADKVEKGAIVVMASDHGVVADGTTDSSVALAAAITAAGVGGTVQLPPSGNVLIKSPVQVTTNGLTIKSGNQYQSRIYASACNGIEVAAGVTGFTLQGVEVVSTARYTNTANSLVGIKFNGTTDSHCSNHLLRDVYIDGFETAVYGNYLWSTVFDHFGCNFGKYGIDVYGKSVNNFVTNGCSVQVGQGISGSRAIRLTGNDGSSSGTAVGSEGWIIADSLTYGADIGVELIGCPHVSIHDCIIDFNQQYGVRIRDNGTNFGGNTRISGNYIGMTGTSGVAGIDSNNGVNNAACAANRISENHITVYSGSTCDKGITVTGAYGVSIIRANTIQGMTTRDIDTASIAGNTIAENICKSTAPTYNIYSNAGVLNLVTNNAGRVFLSGGNPNAYETIGGLKVARGVQAPTAGTWMLGDRVINAHPATGSPKGWVCTAAGTPGTWVSEGTL